MFPKCLFSLYAKLSSHLFAIQERVAVNMQEAVKIKIVPSYHQELVSHPMSEHIEALFTKQFQQPFPGSY